MFQKEISIPQPLILLLKKKKEVKIRTEKEETYVTIRAADQKKLRHLISNIEQTKTVYNKMRGLLYE